MNNKQNIPFFSICIPSYHSKDTIENAVNSIILQDFDDYEILIADQGDTNSSLIFNENKKIKIFHIEKPCSYMARIFLINNSSGKYILSLDADDSYKKGTLAMIYSLINETDNCDIYFFKHFESNYFKEKDYKLSNISSINKDLIFEDGLLSIWSKCFVNKKYNFVNADIFQYDDVLISLQIISQSKNGFFSNNSFYNYLCIPNYIKHLRIKTVFDRFVFLYIARGYYNIYDDRLIKILDKDYSLLFYSLYLLDHLKYANNKIKKSNEYLFCCYIYKTICKNNDIKIKFRIKWLLNGHFTLVYIWNKLKHLLQPKTIKEWNA